MAFEDIIAGLRKSAEAAGTDAEARELLRDGSRVAEAITIAIDATGVGKSVWATAMGVAIAFGNCLGNSVPDVEIRALIIEKTAELTMMNADKRAARNLN